MATPDEVILEDQKLVEQTPLEQIKGLLANIQTGIATLSDEDAELIGNLKNKLQEVKDLLPPPQSEMGGRRRSAKKRGTQRKQKRRQRRGSRRAY